MKLFSHKRTLSIALITLLLAACSNDDYLCSNKKVLTLLTEKLQVDLKDTTTETLEDFLTKQDTLTKVDKSTINKLTKKNYFSVEKILTLEKSEKTSKQVCEAELSITIPEDVLKKGNNSIALKAAAEENKSSFFSNKYQNFDEYLKNTGSNLKKTTDKKAVYTTKLTYEVQPYDDKSSYNISYHSHSIHQVAFLLSMTVLNDYFKNYQEEERQKEFVKKQELAKTEANIQQAKLEQTTIDNNEADKDLNEVWQELKKEKKDELLASQRAWVKEKDATCQKAFLEKDGTDIEKKIAKLDCETDMIRTRRSYLSRQRFL